MSEPPIPPDRPLRKLADSDDEEKSESDIPLLPNSTPHICVTADRLRDIQAHANYRRMSPVRRTARRRTEIEEIGEIRARIINETAEIYDVEDELCDITIICKNGKQFPAERSMLARSSEVFFKMLTTNMKEGQTGVINVPEFDISTVRRCYRTVVREILSPNRDQEPSDASLPCERSYTRWVVPRNRIDNLSEDLRFAQMYAVTVMNQIIRRYILRVAPSQTSFDLDSEYDLDIRKALLMNVLIHFASGQNIWDPHLRSAKKNPVTFTDLGIYEELKALIFTDPFQDCLRGGFMESFIQSGFRPEKLGDIVRRLGKSEIVHLAESIENMEERWTFLKSAMNP